MKCLFLIALTLAVTLLPLRGYADWAVKQNHIVTRWAKDVSPQNALPEYPRPGMARADWLNLNGLWDYAIKPFPENDCREFKGQILVPYPAESALSGVAERVLPNQRLWYRRTFDVPETWTDKRVLLHFGAVDWECSVRVNGKELLVHRGGYDAFSVDITDALKPGAAQELVLSVWDPTDGGYQSRGKQVLDPNGIWYTAVTGIWQTVWLEPVNATSIERLQIATDIDRNTVEVRSLPRGAQPGDVVEAQALDGGQPVATLELPAGQPLTLPIAQPKLWSPDSPFLYDLKVRIKRGGVTLDEVSGYFGMRKISLGKDAQGMLRLCLNNAPLFQFGPLDQGWWPDGLYTAPTDEALRSDIEATKAMGFNMARKHVKVEPERWYYHCDKLGLLVWQDMPAGDRFVGRKDSDLARGEESKAAYFREFKAIIEQRYNHPSVIMWVPFNEGWGQFETGAVTDWVRQQDPTRLVNATSGWADRGVSDVHDKHDYPGPGMFPPEAGRASVLGEFGGLGLAVKEHCWIDTANWGYAEFKDVPGLRDAYADLIKKLTPMAAQGLSAAVYTQTTDCETEVNGLMTYDRAQVKMEAGWLAETNKPVYSAAEGK